MALRTQTTQGMTLRRPAAAARRHVVARAAPKAAPPSTAGRVKQVTGTEAGQMMKDDWVLLDVRSPAEVQKVPIVGAVEVPIFKEAEGSDLGTFLAKYAHFGTGGWWVGGTHMVPNQTFISDVQSKIGKDSKVIVACQKGLRSLAASEQLSRAGYDQGIAWINGGFDSCRKGDLATKDDVDIRYAGIGGLSEVLGWTEVQQEEKKEKLGGVNGVLSVFVAILAADLLLFAYEFVQTKLQN